jgi:hypothetical protein
MAGEMKSNNDETQVFIVRLWRERREIEGARPVLRGTVEHVSSSKRLSVRDVSGVVTFLLRYVEAMDVSVDDGVATQAADPPESIHTTARGSR